MIAGPALDVKTTLLDALQGYARADAHRDAVRFLANGEDVASRMTYAELLRAVNAVAGGLIARDLVGVPVVLALPPGIEFVVAALACFRAGAYAVTIPFPPRTHEERIAAIVRDARPAAIVADLSGDARLPAELSGPPVFGLDALPESASLPPEPSAASPALIQYSSGSTREPCGVAITHGNLAANLRMIERAFGIETGDVGVSWLPPSHDMGLIGTILAPLFKGCTPVLMPPMAFFQKPIRWLRAISTHRAAIQGAPNFGYELCTRRVTAEAARELDLANWRVAFCGAEPIRLRTLDDFASRFAAGGFARSAFLACYGLAETTLLCSSGPARDVALEAGRVAFSRVSCGRPAVGCTILLRPPHDEICVSGAHVTPGRWDGERGVVVPWDGEFVVDGARFFPTGDAGIAVDGEIVVVDRLKDTISIHGRKVHAIDVERAVLDGDEGIVAAAAAFAVPSDRGERLVTLCEISRRDRDRSDGPALQATLGALVSTATGVVPEIVFVRAGALPRTSSGKIRRYAAREQYLCGELS